MLKLSMNTAIEMMDDGKKPPLEEVIAAMKAAVVYIDRTTTEPKVQTTLDEIRKLAVDTSNRVTNMDEKITQIKHQAASSTGTSSGASYASILSRASMPGGVPLPPFSNPIPPHQGNTPYSKNNEIVIKLQDETANKALEKKTPQEMTKLVNDFIKSIDTTRKDIRAAKRLASGDVCVMAANEEEAHALRGHKEWIMKLSENAKAVTRTYGILLHGVRIDALPKMNEMATVAKAIQNENVSTLSLSIEWIGWFSPIRDNMDRASLIIELADSDEANKAMEEGLVIGSELHGCCVYNRQCRLKQCFECWKYGHISTSCPDKGKQVCGKCTEGHHHKECKATVRKCAVCGGSHEAWNKVCIGRKKEILRIKQARALTPMRFASKKDSQISHQTGNQPTRNYFQNTVNQLRGEAEFPRLPASSRGLTGRERYMRGRKDIPELNRSTTPILQRPGRGNSSISPARSSNRNKSPSKATIEAEEYNKAVATGEISDPTRARAPLSQKSDNGRIAIPATNNMQKRRIQEVTNGGKENVEEDQDKMPGVEYGNLNQECTW